MKKKFLLSTTIFAIIFSTQILSAQSIKPAPPPTGFQNKYETVNGIKIHYVIGGKGEPLLLIHGFGQNWFMWDRLMPELSKHFTIVAPDLLGVGESGKPKNGYEKKQWRPTCTGL